eukprot:ctg_781.g357
MAERIPRQEGTTRPAFNAYEKHVNDVNNYIIPYGKDNEVLGNTRNLETDLDVLKREYRFIRGSEEEDEKSWETRLARRHYDRLYKEYALVDLSKWRQGNVGLRWLTQTELLEGKGYSVCAELKCTTEEDIKAVEVPFVYDEVGNKKVTLVKVHLCQNCLVKLRESYRIARQQKS